jgi:hypothetical protein
MEARVAAAIASSHRPRLDPSRSPRMFHTPLLPLSLVLGSPQMRYRVPVSRCLFACAARNRLATALVGCTVLLPPVRMQACFGGDPTHDSSSHLRHGVLDCSAGTIGLTHRSRGPTAHISPPDAPPQDESSFPQRPDSPSFELVDRRSGSPWKRQRRCHIQHVGDAMASSFRRDDVRGGENPVSEQSHTQRVIGGRRRSVPSKGLPKLVIRRDGRVPQPADRIGMFPYARSSSPLLFKILTGSPSSCQLLRCAALHGRAKASPVTAMQ